MTRRAPCGTNAGYSSHRRHKTTPCQPCRDAHAAHNRQYKTRPKPPDPIAFLGTWRRDGLVWRPVGMTAAERFGDVA